MRLMPKRHVPLIAPMSRPPSYSTSFLFPCSHVFPAFKPWGKELVARLSELREHGNTFSLIHGVLRN